jgi:hypothetical protein
MNGDDFESPASTPPALRGACYKPKNSDKSRAGRHTFNRLGAGSLRKSASIPLRGPDDIRDSRISYCDAKASPTKSERNATHNAVTCKVGAFQLKSRHLDSFASCLTHPLAPVRLSRSLPSGSALAQKTIHLRKPATRPAFITLRHGKREASKTAPHRSP